MINLRRQLCCFFLLVGLWATSLPLAANAIKTKYQVIIDTDCAADDLRAITYLLANPEVEVLAITTCHGAILPKDGAYKVDSLLKHFYHQGIPIGEGEALDYPTPPWGKMAKKIAWGEPQNYSVPTSFLKASTVMTRAIEQATLPVIIMALGSLHNAATVLSHDNLLQNKIDRIIWYNTSISPLQGSNYDAAPIAFETIRHMPIKLHVVSAEQGKPQAASSNFIKALGDVNNPYAKLIHQTHTEQPLLPLSQSNHLKLWDDLCALFLLYPTLFEGKTIDEHCTIYGLKTHYSDTKIAHIFKQLLLPDNFNPNQLFSLFPVNATDYQTDVAAILSEALARYGKDEWRAAVLSSELHGHLGIYAIIGVKMGIRVREYFNIGIDDVMIMSYAGSRPPISCLNDGLQVSTGGTLGHGLIRQATITEPTAQAFFFCKNKQVGLRLKAEYAKQIAKDVQEGIRLYGDLTPAYWDYIRKLALRYWVELDRREIFEVIEPLGVF